MANGTVYRRDDRKKPWVVHVSWLEGDRRRQSKKSYSTKKEAQEALATAIDAHRRQDFVAPTDLESATSSTRGSTRSRRRVAR